MDHTWPAIEKIIIKKSDNNKKTKLKNKRFVRLKIGNWCLLAEALPDRIRFPTVAYQTRSKCDPVQRRLMFFWYLIASFCRPFSAYKSTAWSITRRDDRTEWAKRRRGHTCDFVSLHSVESNSVGGIKAFKVLLCGRINFIPHRFVLCLIFGFELPLFLLLDFICYFVTYQMDF